jgi:hypothetical protein
MAAVEGEGSWKNASRQTDVKKSKQDIDFSNRWRIYV